jgi:hypothetical protein
MQLAQYGQLVLNVTLPQSDVSQIRSFFFSLARLSSITPFFLTRRQLSQLKLFQLREAA